MTDRLKLILPIVVLAAGAAAAALVFLTRPAVERQEAATPPPLVRVTEVVLHDLRLDVDSNGTVEPLRRSSLVAQVAGQVTAVSPSFAEGGFFGRGEVLVEIDRRDYELAVRQAESQVARAEVQLDREQAEAEVARQEWSELGTGRPSPLTLREPQLAEARAALEAARATLERARLDLTRTAVRAPFEGRLREKRVDLGQYVTPGTPLAVVYSTEQAEIRLPVSEEDLAFVDVDLGETPAAGSGPEVRVHGEVGGRRHTWSARIVRSDSQFDPRTRMLDLFARVEDPYGRDAEERRPLPMGLFVVAEIAGRTASGVAVLPRAALRGGGRVLVVDGDSRLRFRDVEILRLEDDEVVVAAGLEPGERVCISPLDSVVDGMSVRTQPAEEGDG